MPPIDSAKASRVRYDSRFEMPSGRRKLCGSCRGPRAGLVMLLRTATQLMDVTTRAAAHATEAARTLG